MTLDVERAGKFSSVFLRMASGRIDCSMGKIAGNVEKSDSVGKMEDGDM